MQRRLQLEVHDEPSFCRRGRLRRREVSAAAPRKRPSVRLTRHLGRGRDDAQRVPTPCREREDGPSTHARDDSRPHHVTTPAAVVAKAEGTRHAKLPIPGEKDDDDDDDDDHDDHNHVWVSERVESMRATEQSEYSVCLVSLVCLACGRLAQQTTTATH